MTPNPSIPRERTWFHQQLGARCQLWSWKSGNLRAFVRQNWDGAVTWAVCEVGAEAEWSAAGGVESAQGLAMQTAAFRVLGRAS